MIKEALQYIENLITDAQKKDEIIIGNDTYTEKDLRLVLPNVNHCQTLNFNNLSMLIENINNELEDEHNLPLIINVSEQSVTVYTSYDINKKREIPFVAKASTPKIDFNRYISVEEMIIQLLTCFKDTTNRNNLIQLLSSLSQDQKISYEDDGFTQKVVSKEGVSLQSEVVINPLVKLIPQRTFYEIEQPEQMFLIRVNKLGQVALFDADGESWKVHCQKAIIKYLQEQLQDQYEEGKVIVC